MTSTTASPQDDSPMMRQWAAIKAEHEDCIVLFRLGDFYEAFYEDASTVARVCDVTLTSRPVKKAVRAPMAGVPFHAADTYIGRLVRAGYRVAIVEQLGDASPKRAGMSPPRSAPAQPASDGIIARDVVRIVTPGTLLDSAVLEPGANNHLAAVAWVGDRVGLSHVDLSTGEFATTDLGAAAAELLDQLARLDPVEIVISDAGREANPFLTGVSRAAGQPVILTSIAAHRAHEEGARRALREHFDVATLIPFGCDDRPAALVAAGMVIAYLMDTQKGTVGRLRSLSTYDVDRLMHLDLDTRRNLELVTTIQGAAGRGTLLAVLDETATPMGARLLRRRLEAPLADLERIDRRLDEVALMVDSPALREQVRDLLSPVGDVERIIARVVAGYAGPRETLRLADGLRSIPALMEALDSAAAATAGAAAAGLRSLFSNGASDAADVVREIESAIDPDAPVAPGVVGVIRRGYDAELDAIHDGAAEARRWIAGLEDAERTRTGVKSLKVGFNRVFGYYLEVPKHATANLPDSYVRRQTVATAERYITPELKAREDEVQTADERIIALERSLYRDLLGKVAGAAPRLVDVAIDMARLDVAAALAEVAHRRGYTRPTLTESREISIGAGRHPVVEALAAPGTYVPTEVEMEDGEILLLTGPNMAGKSTVLRQVALVALMAQIGSFVPAARARIGLVDRIFSRIGARDELALGQSTFMVEMVETARILHQATPRSLVLFDELGRGTSTYDGMAIAWAVLEAIHDSPRLGCRTLFATHFHELTSLAERLDRLRNAHMVVADDDGSVTFLHQVASGPADRSYGIHVAQLAGLPAAVTARAWEILGRLERDGLLPWQPAVDRPALAGGQLVLFAPAPPQPHPLIGTLREIDPNTMTPLEALTTLADLVRRSLETPYP